MAKTLIARLRESQSKHPAPSASKQVQQPTGQQVPKRSLIDFLRRQEAQEQTRQPAAERPRNLFEAALQQQAQAQNQQPTGQQVPKRSLIDFLRQQEAQALNQQPDSIPAMMKPGEYVLPPDTVQALGGPGALDAAVAQTHTPSDAGAVVPEGFEPRQFFNNGGMADDEPQPAAPAPTPRAQFVADQNAKLADGNARLAERTQQMNARYQPAPNSPNSTFPGNRQATPPAATASAAPAQDSRGFAGFQPHRFDSSMAAPQSGPGFQPGAMAQALNQQPAAERPRNLFEFSRQQQAQVQNQQPAAQAAPTGQQVGGVPGAYKHGYGQYSDNAKGMGLPQGFTGQPNAQNMQAANNLAGQEQKRSMISAMREQQAQQQAMQQQAMQPRGFAAPQINHSGNDFTAQQNLRRLKMDAEWAMQRARRKKYAAQDPAVMAYQAALQGDTAARYGGQAALEAKTNDTNAGLQREQMQQDGANQREADQNVIARARLANEQRQQVASNDLAERRFALDERKAGMANIPSGYRAAADGQGLEAIPGGPADPTAGKAAQQRRDDAGQVLEILDLARPLVDKSTGSYLGTAFDKAAQVFGETTKGANAAAQLKVLQGALVSKMPRMEGPQSDRDVELYREMAARIGDSTVPREQRLEAMDMLDALQQKYAPQQPNRPQGSQGGKGVQGGQQPQRGVMRTGVYNGRRVVQYEDGSLSYAD